jgi:amino acid permease
VVIPLSFLRRLDSLKYTSFVALVSIGYLIIIVVGHFLVGDTLADRGDISPIKWAGPIEALSTFPVVVFAYTCHQNVSIRRMVSSGRMEADSKPDVFHRE